MKIMNEKKVFIFIHKIIIYLLEVYEFNPFFHLILYQNSIKSYESSILVYLFWQYK
jgi:hypothetical protein